ncbi:hypothetical protein V6N11_019720 [Hibiscus sabdariffa]
MHCLGFSLNLLFYDSKYLNVETPGGVARRTPNQDQEVIAGFLKAFDRLGEDENKKTDLRRQLVKFQNKQGMFRTTHVRIDAITMGLISWWSTYGSKTPELAEIAIRVLSQLIAVIQQRECGALTLTFTISKETDSMLRVLTN